MDSKYIKWSTLAFMAFSTVWGFGNVVNGFVYFNGIQVIFSWIFMFALYFIPYALMVGELGSAFKESGGGVSSWILKTTGPKLAYYAGVFRNAETYDTFPTIGVQLVTFAVLLLFCWVASRGLNPLKKLAAIAGTSMFVMSILYIVMIFAARAINPGADYVTLDLSMKSLIPEFNVKYFTSLSILVFAVGGCEKISPYVNKVKDPSKGFPKAMITLAIMVVVCAILGTIAMGMMFDPAVINGSKESFNSYVSNGSYWAFQKLGQYYGIGDTLLVVYAICNAIGQLSTLVISIDAPLRMLLDNEDAQKFIPSTLLKKNDTGAYVNGIKMVAILSGSIILIQSFVPGAAAVLKQLTKLNSVCMPMRYLWVFTAYIALRKAGSKFNPEYRFVKNDTLALAAGGWCFFVTAACCLLGVYDTDLFTMCLNIITPCVLTALGIILPMIKKRELQSAAK